MRIKKFNESITINNVEVYTERTKTLMDRFWKKEKVRYIIAKVDERTPEKNSGYSDFDIAINQLQAYDEEYCIYEMTIRPLTEEELRLKIDTNKYNL